MKKTSPLVGIDYGSKLAGTTVLAWSWNRKDVQFSSSKKGEDADQFLKRNLLELKPRQVYIDAPLSLPGVYTQPTAYSDYFYRKADRELQAMSPMFLGGLTARAMQLSADLKSNRISCMEVYPTALARYLRLKERGYKREKEKIPLLLEYIKSKSYFPISSLTLPSWHYFDALLALMSGHRLEQQRVAGFGEEREGLIYV